MMTLRLLRGISGLVALFGLANSALAAPFPSLTFQGSFPGVSRTVNPCDTLNCEGFFEPFETGALPQFGFVGKTLLAAQFSYNIQVKAQSIGTNNTNIAVDSFTGNHVYVDLRILALGPASVYFVSDDICCGGSGMTLLPGQSMGFGLLTVQVMDSLLLLPGDVLYSQFLGGGDVSLGSRGFASEHGNVRKAACVVDCFVSPLQAPILLFGAFSGNFGVTYRYCTPGVDFACPDAIPGFNSPIPAPATLFLFASGFAVVIAGAASRRRQS